MDDLLTHTALLAADQCAAGAQSAPAVTVEWLSGGGALTRLEPEWDDLVARAGHDHPFASHAWLASWWQAFGDGADLRVLTARRGAAIAGLALLMRRPGARRWQSLHNAHTPRVDWPVDRAYAGETFDALWRGLAPVVRSDGIDVGDLPESSATLAALTARARAEGVLVGLQATIVSPAIDTDRPWDAYLESLSPRHRRNMRSRLAKLARLGAVELEVVSGGQELHTALEQGLWLEAAAWKREQGTAILAGDDLCAFYTGLAERAAACGRLRLIFLRAGGRRVAFAYALQHGAGLFLLKIGYDPAVARLSPGQLQFWCLLQHACADPDIREVDLLGSFDDWKRLWTRHGRRHTRLTLFGRGLPGRIEHTLRFRAMPLLRRSPLHAFCSRTRAGFRRVITPDAD